MIDPLELIRENLRALKPYSSARSEFSGQASIYLDANENSFGSLISAEQAASFGGGNYNRYPDPLHKKVRTRIAELKRVPVETIFLGSGSDEAIDLLFRLFCVPGRDAVLITPPTYGMYEVSADINDVRILRAPLTANFRLDWGSLEKGFLESPRMVFLCSPNNPTGNALDSTLVDRVLREYPGIVVVDEAYIDFCPEKSLLPRLAEFPNLVILQTLSKAWGLAGLRVGMAFASPGVVDYLNRIKPPYNISSLVQDATLSALERVDEKERLVAAILSERRRLERELGKSRLVETIYPSDANFLLLRTVDGTRIYKRLLERGIVVRDRSKVFLCDRSLRITVGTPAENTALIDAMRVLEREFT